MNLFGSRQPTILREAYRFWVWVSSQRSKHRTLIYVRDIRTLRPCSLRSSELPDASRAGLLFRHRSPARNFYETARIHAARLDAELPDRGYRNGRVVLWWSELQTKRRRTGCIRPAGAVLARVLLSLSLYSRLNSSLFDIPSSPVKRDEYSIFSKYSLILRMDYVPFRETSY